RAPIGVGGSSAQLEHDYRGGAALLAASDGFGDPAEVQDLGELRDLVRVQATEMLVARADTLAWELGLRGCDAVHLASALWWQEGLDQPVAMVVFDPTTRRR
ncbi:MAG: hypothetical protein ACOC7N_04210, partial [Chloroflexota bacterium]